METHQILGDHTPVLKKFFRMTAEAISNPVFEKNLLTENEFSEWIQELKNVENNQDAIALMFPTIAAWGN